MQAPFVIEALRLLRAEGVHTALDTCGFARWQDLRDAAAQADLVLYDLKLMDEARHQAATGVSNRVILQNLQGPDGRPRQHLDPRARSSRASTTTRPTSRPRRRSCGRSPGIRRWTCCPTTRRARRSSPAWA